MQLETVVRRSGVFRRPNSQPEQKCSPIDDAEVDCCDLQRAELEIDDERSAHRPRAMTRCESTSIRHPAIFFSGRHPSAKLVSANAVTYFGLSFSIANPFR